MPEKPRKKASYVGVPAIFELRMACNHLEKGFAGETYLVGSSLVKPSWRDVDIVMIMDDEDFEKEFPNAGSKDCRWEFDPKWLVMTCSISKWLSEKTGLPIDFKFQPQTWANEHHNGRRAGIGMFIVGEKPC